MEAKSKTYHGEYCCGCCDQWVTNGRVTYVPWYRIADGPMTTTMGFCDRCIAAKKPNETGQAAAIRMLRGGAS